MSPPLAWAIVGSVAAVLALPLMIWIYLSQRPKTKQLRYVVATSQILSEKSLRGLSLSLRSGETVVESPHLVRLSVTNSGSAPVVRADFERALAISVGDSASIVAIMQRRHTPSSIAPSIAPGAGPRPSTLEVDPLLLNPGDTFRLELVTDGAPNIALSARIAGVESVTLGPDIPSLMRPFAKGRLAAAILLATCMAGGELAYVALSPSLSTFDWVVPFTLAAVQLSMAAWYFNLERRVWAMILKGE